MLWYMIGIFLAVAAFIAAQKSVNMGIEGMGVEQSTLAAVLLISAIICWRKGWRVRPLKRGAMRPLLPSVKNQPGQLTAVINSTLFSEGPQAAYDAIRSHAEVYNMKEDAVRKEVFSSVHFLVDGMVDNDSLPQKEFSGIQELLELFEIKDGDTQGPEQAETPAPGPGKPGHIAGALPSAAEHLGRVLLVRDLLTDKTPHPFNVDNLPFELMKREVPLCCLPEVTGYTHINSSDPSSKTLPIQLEHHVYWRAQDLETRIVREKNLRKIGTGPLAVTDRHFYFMADAQVTRVKHENIGRILPTLGSVIIYRKGKPVLEFWLDDPWFLANVLSNVRPE